MTKKNLVKEMNLSWAHPLMYRNKYRANDRNLIHALAYDFNNTALFPYLSAVVSFFAKEPLLNLDFAVPQIAREALMEHVSRCLALAICLKTFKQTENNRSALKGLAKEDQEKIYAFVEEYSFKVMDYFELSDYDSLLNPPDPFGSCNAQTKHDPDLEQWKELFSDLPCSCSFEYEDVERDEKGNEIENGEKHLSIKEVNYLVKRWEYYEALAHSLKIETDKPIITRFLEYMLEAGIPHSRKIYTELYRVLDNFGLIPSYVKDSHKISTSKYNESNYIKAAVSRISKNT